MYGAVYLTGMATVSSVRGRVPYGDGRNKLCTGKCTLWGWPQWALYAEVYLTRMAKVSYVRGGVPYGDGHSELFTEKTTLRGWPQ
ncbi:hypothetical protein DPMN_114510 [Dreissena polymorpha]|uniref:Uncharacterized protein n=1 Tax=Dreissena polymorpha TaxID=45954 RepID=A0A9D4QRM0_DREPO|nr:hypothetical protein DPMN_114510 [Dreissena polymorpha]